MKKRNHLPEINNDDDYWCCMFLFNQQLKETKKSKLIYLRKKFLACIKANLIN